MSFLKKVGKWFGEDDPAIKAADRFKQDCQQIGQAVGASGGVGGESEDKIGEV